MSGVFFRTRCRTASTLGILKSKLKTELFTLAYLCNQDSSALLQTALLIRSNYYVTLFLALCDIVFRLDYIR